MKEEIQGMIKFKKTDYELIIDIIEINNIKITFRSRFNEKIKYVVVSKVANKNYRFFVKEPYEKKFKEIDNLRKDIINWKNKIQKEKNEKN